VSTTVAPIDPLRSCPAGRYADERLIVEPGRPLGVTAAATGDGRILVRHHLRPAELDDELGAALAAALAPLTDDHDVFARAFTGVVLTSAPQAERAWELFYRNTLARIRHAEPGYSAIYRRALELLPRGEVLDLGCSFGFLALHLAARGDRVTAAEIDAGTTTLVRSMARRLRRPVEVVRADGAALPLPDGCVDAVAVLHVLEHVDDATGAEVLTEARRLARSRVVVAVPFEERPTALFGHVRRIDAHHLYQLGHASGWSFDIHRHHGGWLVLDRPVRHHR
jgi:precorrin-6B methylase 2